MKNKLLALICALSFYPYCLIIGQIWQPVVTEYNIDEFFHDLTWYITHESDTIAHGGNQVGSPYQFIIPPQRRAYFIPDEGCITLTVTNGACLGFQPALSGAAYNLRLMRSNGEVIHQVGPAEFTACSYSHTINLSNPGADCPPPPDPPSTCLGDLNGDGTVGIIDLIIFIVQYGTNCN